MSLKERMTENAANRAGKMLIDGLETIHKDQRLIENHQITIQNNQCEQEVYLKDIIARLDRIEKRQDNK